MQIAVNINILDPNSKYSVTYKPYQILNLETVMSVTLIYYKKHLYMNKFKKRFKNN